MSLCTCIFGKDARPQKKIAWGGDTYTDKHTDIATTRNNWPKSRFFGKYKIQLQAHFINQVANFS